MLTYYLIGVCLGVAAIAVAINLAILTRNPVINISNETPPAANFQGIRPDLHNDRLVFFLNKQGVVGNWRDTVETLTGRAIADGSWVHVYVLRDLEPNSRLKKVHQYDIPMRNVLLIQPLPAILKEAQSDQAT